jgi:hypothetical protein
MAPERLEDLTFSEIPGRQQRKHKGVRCPEWRMEFRDFLKILMTKSNFGPTETLIISVRFLFLNQPRRSLEGLSRCRVILLTRFDVPWLQISEIFGTSQPPVTRLAGVPLWIVDRGTEFRDFLKISMTKSNFGPIETLIISLCFLFLNQPRGSLEGLSRCRVILLTHMDAPLLQSASKSRHFRESPVSSSANSRGPVVGSGGWDFVIF